MEQFIVSARKYRPETFEDVVGQQAITNTLENAINNNHLAQALLFTGPRGVGKTTCARILAKKINQYASDDNTEQDFAFNIFELDAASNNSVDDIRNLIDQIRIPPQVGKYKVYIIDEVHMLSSSAFNAFLKTLEEPPKHTIFILATTEKHKIIPTILSRCQIFDFKRITVTDAKEHLAKIALKEGVEAEDDALHIIAQKADGAMRDALSIYDRVVSYCGNKLTRAAVTENLNVLDYETYFKSTDLILENNIPELLLQFNQILAKGFDAQHYINGLASHFRDVLVCKHPETIALLEVGEQIKTKYLEQSKKCNREFLLEAIDLANTCDLQYKTSKNQRLLVELCLMQIASITFDGEKKKPKHFIIAASHFAQVIPNNPPPIVQQNVATVKEEKEPYTKATKNTQSITTESSATVKLTSERKKKTSGLSLKSIREKKELLKQQQLNKPEEKVLNQNFTEQQLQEAWVAYGEILKEKGQKILYSIIKTDTPKLENNKIKVVLPNATMKIDLERAQGKLLAYLAETLNNNQCQLEILVNETTAKKFAFTPREKYEQLKEKNPLLDKLRTTFDLEL
ncbi:DNA polymerase-3 subunit gamma/tau [Mesonia hippocampi]|uniref:DNA polymerase III subunit gamma/tau n=1 Tax=Mesonia hippocampi TaxID=1628250 RepID=A0A840EZW4_9FLAO|nr:DNA polymerase III subunit gamma/tau [Mesonia hippocampi]MBB4119564.1 DNA polymerase-3 subunit gamma/tau [Mesonia hippocampi]